MPTTADSLRTVDLRGAGDAHVGVRPCSVEGCNRPTSCGKPVCVKHIARMGYVKEILAELAREERAATVVRLHPLRQAV